MRCNLSRIFLLFIVCVLLRLPAAALADTPTRSVTYKQIAPDGKFVFVMISPQPLERDAGSVNEEDATRIREIRRIYAKSGMYPNDGGSDPLWTVDWFARDVTLAADGVHVFREGPWAFLPRSSELETALDQEAISFFANGQLLQTYLIRELINKPEELKRSVSHLQWKKDGRFNHARLEYTLSTLDGNEFVFDVPTGAIVSESRAWRFPWWGWWMVLGGVAVFTVTWLKWRLRNRTRRVAS